MSSRRGFVFVDNNSALATLIKRSSQSDAMFRVMDYPTFEIDPGGNKQ